MRSRRWFLRIAVLALAISFVAWMVHAWQERSYPTLVAEAMITIGVLYWSLHVRISGAVPAAQRWRVGTGAQSLVIRPNTLRVLAFMAAS